MSPMSSNEPRRVRQMIDRLESSSTSSNTKPTKKLSTKKSFHDDHSTDSINYMTTNTTMAPEALSTPITLPIQRIVRRENHEKRYYHPTSQKL